ncbi:MAG: hypothetical protein Q8R04_04065 [Nanoarchaeota archaeon]|nr:hypothetical protein [Nanoarchaeota archaeon]
MEYALETYQMYKLYGPKPEDEMAEVKVLLRRGAQTIEGIGKGIGLEDAMLQAVGMATGLGDLLESTSHHQRVEHSGLAYAFPMLHVKGEDKPLSTFGVGRTDETALVNAVLHGANKLLHERAAK